MPENRRSDRRRRRIWVAPKQRPVEADAVRSPQPIELPAPVVAMLGRLSCDAQVELRAALRSLLFPVPTAVQRREDELGCLARLLHDHGQWPPSRRDERRRAYARDIGAMSPGQRWPVMNRELYDRLRDQASPASETLLRRHRTRSWSLICRMAAGLKLPDRDPLVSTVPWINAQRGGPGPRSRAPYERAEACAAVVKAAEALGKPLEELSVTAYSNWARARRRRGRDLGLGQPRLPDYRTIQRLYPRGWRQLIRDATSPG